MYFDDIVNCDSKRRQSKSNSPLGDLRLPLYDSLRNDAVIGEFTLDTYFVSNMTVDAVLFIKQF